MAIRLENQVQPAKNILLKGLSIPLFINEHLSIDEMKVFNIPYRYKKREKIIEYVKKWNDLKPVQRHYAFRLAFLQRIKLDIKIIFSSSVSSHHFPLKLLPNFTNLIDLAEQYFPMFFPERKNDSLYKEKILNELLNITLRLWLCGFGIRNNYGLKTIDTKVLLTFRKHCHSRHTNALKFLAFILVNDKEAPLTTDPFFNKKYPKNNFVIHAKESWDELILKNGHTELGGSFYSFLFTHHVSKIQNNVFLDVPTANGSIQRISEKSITPSTFRYGSDCLKNIYLFFNSKGYTDVEVTIKEGITDYLVSENYRSLSDSLKEKSDAIIRQYLKWYTSKNKIHIKISKIIPNKLRNKDSSEGEVLDLGSAITLLQIIMDNQSPYFDENKLLDLRIRRGLILQLMTGARWSEVAALKRQCVFTNTNDDAFIHFHKTKNSIERFVKIGPDIQNIVKELQSVASPYKISFLSSQYTGGDDLTDFRLIANSSNEKPLVQNSANKWLINLQNKIWKPNMHPNGRNFTTHDFKRLRAIYLRMKGYTKDEIADLLDHTDIDSQLPYLQTRERSHQEAFKDIFLEGIWNNLSTSKGTNGISIDSVLDKNKSYSTNELDEKALYDFIEETFVKLNDLPNNSNLPKVTTGFPLRTHNCLANEVVNCGHTELHCFSCQKYLPDSDKQFEHEAEIFRYILLMNHSKEMSKKSYLEKDEILIKAGSIEKLLKESFKVLFLKFGFDKDQTKKIEVKLHNKAKKYLTKYKKTKPTLSFQESLQYLNKGVL